MNSMSNSKENTQSEKPAPKVKIGKDIYIYRILYLITNEDIFKDKSKKSINFYLKNQSKEKSLFYLPKPQESNIIIEEIKELIELTLSLCILTNTSNYYKISIFTSNFVNIENNSQLLKYQGTILYAKLNEFKKEDIEEKKISKFSSEYKESSKKNIIKKITLKKKTNSVKEFPSFKLKQIFPYKRFGITLLNNKEKSNLLDLENSLTKERNNEENIHNRSNSNSNIIPKLPIVISANCNLSNNTNLYDDSSFREKNIDSLSFNFRDSIHKNKNLNFLHKFEPENNKFNYFSQSKFFKKVNNKNNQYFLTQKQLYSSKSDLNLNAFNDHIFSFPKNSSPNNGYSRSLYRNKSLQMKNINNIFSTYINNKKRTDNTEYNPQYYKNNLFDIKIDFRSRNRVKHKTKNFTKFRCSFFSKSNSMYNKRSSASNIVNKKIKTLFTKKDDDENLLKDIEKQNKEYLIQQQNVKLIQNFLFKPSIITISKNNFYNLNENRFNSAKNSFIEFKNELKRMSYKLDDYLGDKEMEFFIHDLDKNFTLMGINLKYCLKEYFLYSYFDKYIKDTFPSVAENLLYDPNVTSMEILEVLNSLLIRINKLKNEEKFNLADFVRSLKKIENCKLSSDFFEIFVICPNFFEFTKREITKKIVLILEIDCVTNNVTIENFINYYYIFKYGHLVKLDKKLLFINKLLHMIDGKGGPLQEKIFNDMQCLFKIDNRTKQLLLGRTYEIKMNFHMTLKINQIFNSIVKYFEDNNITKENTNISFNTSFFSNLSQMGKL
jgi:hypothetical protein